jgi:pyruvate kinase
VLAFTPDPSMLSTLALYWGLVPRPIEALGPVADLVSCAEREIATSRLAGPGDAIVYVLGTDASPDAANAVRIARL